MREEVDPEIFRVRRGGRAGRRGAGYGEEAGTEMVWPGGRAAGLAGLGLAGAGRGWAGESDE